MSDATSPFDAEDSVDNPFNVNQTDAGSDDERSVRTDTPQHDRVVSASDNPDWSVRIAGLFLPLYYRVFGKQSDFVQQTHEKLAQARRQSTTELFVARSLGYGVLTGVLLWILGTIGVYTAVSVSGYSPEPLIGLQLPPTLFAAYNLLAVPTLVLISGVIFGVIGFAVGFGTPQLILQTDVSAREREINILLPDTVAYMYALSVGGMNQVEMIEAVAENQDVYGEVSKEFNTIMQETRYFDIDYRTAISNRAKETPSDELAGVLTDMLSIITSGGELTSFLDDETDKQLRESKESQEELVELLELFGEMYLNVSMLPLLLIILVTIMQLMGSGSEILLLLIIYVLIPGIGFGFIVLMSTVLPDEPGDGLLEYDSVDGKSATSGSESSVTEQYQNLSPLFEGIHSQERKYNLLKIIKQPHKYFIENPAQSLIVTVPLSLSMIAVGFVTGIAPTSVDALYQGVGGTIYYIVIPIYLTLIPLTTFVFWSGRKKKSVVNNYTDALRKLSSANNTGQTLLESFITVAETSTGRLSKEFRQINAKVDYDYSLRQALAEFNNKYADAELARINALIIDAQETSSQISDVLATAAHTSENQDKLKRQRESATRMQMVIILMSTLVLMGVIAAVQDQFVAVIGNAAAGLDSGGSGAAGLSFGAIDTTRTGILFFHAVLAQSITSGFLCSYLRTNSLKNVGVYTLPLVTLSLLVWTVIL